MSDPCTMFLCGDVMTGRGIDQVLPHPSDPTLHESYVKNATEYLRLAERAHGSVPRPADFSYVWGIALDELRNRNPDPRLVNLETSVTRSNDPWKNKGIHYRMHPDNLPCLRAAGINPCNLANNHVLDWGYSGLEETLRSLRGAGVRTTGAGLNRVRAAKPAVVEREGGGRILVFGVATPSSGVPESWAAGEDRPGVNYIEDLSESTARGVCERVRDEAKPTDLVVLSIHWGGNWGYDVPRQQVNFAHRLIEGGGVDLIHGHSSHHVKAMEVYRGHLVLYGCGDFLTDYEGIRGHEQYRDDLGCMFFPTLDAESGRLIDLTLVPTQIRRFRIRRPPGEDVRWLRKVLQREGEPFGTAVKQPEKNELKLSWDR